VPRQRFVDSVVDDSIAHMVQAGTVIGVTDIHARSLANRIESLQDPDRFRAIFGWNDVFGFGDGLPGWFSHEMPSKMVPNQRGARRLIDAICATNPAQNLAQSRALQVIE
jgi:hypothetical protein